MKSLKTFKAALIHFMATWWQQDEQDENITAVILSPDRLLIQQTWATLLLTCTCLWPCDTCC